MNKDKTSFGVEGWRKVGETHKIITTRLMSWPTLCREGLLLLAEEVCDDEDEVSTSPSFEDDDPVILAQQSTQHLHM